MRSNAYTVTLHADGLPPDGIDVTAALGGPLAKLRERLDNLESLCSMKIAAAESFTEACKAAGEATQMEPSVIAAYVNAKVRDKLVEHQKRTDQLQLLFEEL